MQKSILVALLLTCLACQVSADCTSSLAALLPDAIKLLNDANNDDLAQFEADLKAAGPAIEAAGVACTGFTPTSQCTDDVVGLEPSLEDILQDIADGDVSQLEKDIDAAAPAFNTAVADCLGFDISAQCSTDLLATLAPGATVVEDIENQDLRDLEADIDDLLPYLQTAIGDCSGNPVNSVCQGDIDNLVPSIANIIGDFETSNYAQLISDLTNAVPQIETTVYDCTGHQVTANCQAALIGLVPIGLAIFNDINSKNWAQLQADLQAGAPQIEAAYQTCATTARLYKALSLETPSQTCIDSLSKIKNIALELYKYDVSSDSSSIVKEIQDNESTIQSVLNACGA